MNIKIAILEDNNVQAEQLIKIINNWGNNKLHAISITHYKTSSDILNDENAINCNLLFSDIELEKNGKPGNKHNKVVRSSSFVARLFAKRSTKDDNQGN